MIRTGDTLKLSLSKNATTSFRAEFQDSIYSKDQPKKSFILFQTDKSPQKHQSMSMIASKYFALNKAKFPIKVSSQTTIQSPTFVFDTRLKNITSFKLMPS